MEYLWCMLKTGKIHRNQKVAVALCKKKECEYLEEPEGEKPICHCPTSLQYVNAFKGNWKKRRERAEEEAEEKGEKEDA